MFQEQQFLKMPANAPFTGAYPRGGHLGHVHPSPLCLMADEKITLIKRLIR